MRTRSLEEKEIQRALSDGYSSGGEQGGIKRPVSADNPPREKGRWGMEARAVVWRREEGKLVSVPQKANVTGFFIRQARRRQPLHSSPDSLAHGPQEETFGKITAPSLEHGKALCIFCMWVCEFG